MTPSDRTRILDILYGSQVQLTARTYVSLIADQCGLSLRQAKKALTELVNDQTLAYQDLYGSTYVMESFSKPVRLTDRFVIVPPDVRPEHACDLNIVIRPGISFGSGHHPTTRLCLEGLDRLFFLEPGLDHLPARAAGDIGTGSGILALAALMAGMDTCMTWEIDANAVSEAQKNAAANRMTGRMTVVNGLMSPDGLELGLIMANLRFPTLKQIAPLIQAALVPDACLLLSGIRTWEIQALKDHYAEHHFIPIWEKNLKNWAVVIFTYTG